MNFDELIERYKMLPLWGRLLALAILGMMPGAYTVWDEQEGLDERLQASQAEEATVKQDFEKKVAQKGDLPRLEEKKAFTQEQLEKAKKMLPDGYKIEEILRRVAVIAKESGVTLLRFDPGVESVVPPTENHYYQLPIAAAVSGQFNQVAGFFDRILHLEGTVFVRNISFRGDKAPAGGVAAEAERLRQEFKLQSDFEIAAFRGMTGEEIAKVDAAAAASKAAAAPKVGKPSPPGPSAATTVVGGGQRM